MAKLIYKFFYNFFWFPVRLIFIVFSDFKVETREDLSRLKGPLIIASNHASWWDSFLIGISFPFMSRIFPIRFACWHKYYYSPRFFFFVWPFGSFPIKKGIELEQALKIPIKILKNKGVVGIFPEGKRRRGGRPRRGRKGAAYLSLKTNTKVLPVKIEGTMNMRVGKFFLRRYKIKVKIGKVLSFPYNQKDISKSAILIMEKIREL